MPKIRVTSQSRPGFFSVWQPAESVPYVPGVALVAPGVIEPWKCMTVPKPPGAGAGSASWFPKSPKMSIHWAAVMNVFAAIP